MFRSTRMGDFVLFPIGAKNYRYFLLMMRFNVEIV